MAEESAKEEPRAATNAAAVSEARRWMRWLFWGGFILGPICTIFAFMDVAAHMEGASGIGFEGNGAPNALPYLFAVVAFACATGGLFARAMSPEPRPPIIAGILLGVVATIATLLVAGPLMRWKWRFDCDHDVAKACWATGQLERDASAKAALEAKACKLGDKRGCPKDEAAPDASASAAPPVSASPSAAP